MPNRKIDVVRSVYPKFKDIPDDELTVMYAEQFPSYLEDAEFKADYDRITGKSQTVEAPPENPGIMTGLGRGAAAGGIGMLRDFKSAAETVSWLIGDEKSARRIEKEVAELTKLQEEQAALSGGGLPSKIGAGAVSIIPTIAAGLLSRNPAVAAEVYASGTGAVAATGARAALADFAKRRIAQATTPAMLGMESVAGMQSAAGTNYEAKRAYLEQNMEKVARGEMTQEEAERDARLRAIPVAIQSGLQTGVITGLFGPAGVEAVGGRQALAQGTREAAETAARRATAEGATSEGVKLSGKVAANRFAAVEQAKALLASSIPKSLIKGATSEGFEEGIDQLSQVVLRKLTFNPELTLKQAVDEVIDAVVVGGILGGTVEVGARQLFKGKAEKVVEQDKLYRQAVDQAEAASKVAATRQELRQEDEERANLGLPPLDRITGEQSADIQAVQQEVYDAEDALTKQLKEEFKVKKAAEREAKIVSDQEKANSRLEFLRDAETKASGGVTASDIFEIQKEQEAKAKTAVELTQVPEGGGLPVKSPSIDIRSAEAASARLAEAAGKSVAVTTPSLVTSKGNSPSLVALAQTHASVIFTSTSESDTKAAWDALNRFPESVRNEAYNNAQREVAGVESEEKTERASVGIKSEAEVVAEPVSFVDKGPSPATVTEDVTEQSEGVTALQSRMDAVLGVHSAPTPAQSTPLRTAEEIRIERLKADVASAPDAISLVRAKRRLKEVTAEGKTKRYAAAEAGATTEADTLENPAEVVREVTNRILRMLGLKVLPKNLKVVYRPELNFAGYHQSGEIIINAARIVNVEAVVIEEALHAVWLDPELQAAWDKVKDTVTIQDIDEQRLRSAADGRYPNSAELREEAAVAKLVRYRTPAVKGFLISIRRAIAKAFGFYVRISHIELIQKAAISKLTADSEASVQGGGVRYAAAEMGKLSPDEQTIYDKVLKTYGPTTRTVQRNATLAVMAQRLKTGKITGDDYRDQVAELDRAIPKKSALVPSDNDLKEFLIRDQPLKVNARVETGKYVLVRHNVNANIRSKSQGKDITPIVVHDESGNVISYLGAVTLEDVKFSSNAIAAMNVATGGAKTTDVATVDGKFKNGNSIPDNLDDGSVWTQIGYNPVRSSEFRIIGSNQPVSSATEAVLVGGRVYAKGVESEKEPDYAKSGRYAAAERGEGSLKAKLAEAGVSAAATNMQLERKGALADESFWTMWQAALRDVGLSGMASGKNLIKNAEIAARDVAKWLKSNPKYLDYYHTDRETTQKTLKSEFPKMSDDQFFAFRIMTGLTSPSTKLPDNMLDAVKLLNHIVGGGRLHDLRLRVSNKGNRATAEDNPFKLASTTGATKIFSLHAVEDIYDKLGSWKAVAEWLAQPVPHSDLHSIKKSLGYKGGVGDIGGSRKVVMEATGQDKLVPRAFIFGQKVGSYTLNSLGYDKFTTTDIWEGRFIRSHFPHMFESGTGLPENVTEQAIFQEFSTRFNKNIQAILGKSLPPSALQAARWFFMIEHASKAGYKYAKTTETISEYVRRAIESNRSKLNNATGNRDGGESRYATSQPDASAQPERAGRQEPTRYAASQRGVGSRLGILSGNTGGVDYLNWADRLRTNFVTKFSDITKMERVLRESAGMGVAEFGMERWFERLAGVSGIAKASIIEMRAELDPLVAGDEKAFNQYIFWQYVERRSSLRAKALADIASAQAKVAAGIATAADKDSIVSNRKLVGEMEFEGYNNNSVAVRRLARLRASMTSNGTLANMDSAVGVYTKHTNKALDGVVASGYLAQGTVDAYRAQFPVYIPIINLQIPDSKNGYQVAKGRRGISDPNFKMKSPLDAFDEYIFRMHVKAEMNKAKRRIHNLAVKSNRPDIARVENVETGTYYSSESYFHVRIKGVDTVVVAHPQVVAAVNSFSETAANALTDILQKANATLKFGATSASLAFQIRNLFFGDLPTLALMSKAGISNPKDVITFVIDVVTSFGHNYNASFRGEYSPLMLEFMKSGAMGSSMHSAIDSLSRDPATGVSSERGIFKYIIDSFGKVSNTIEQTSKLAGFKRLMDKAGVDNLSDLNDPIKQMALVAEVRNYCGSPDFARNGSLMGVAMVRMGTVFLNPAMAGNVSALERLTANLNKNASKSEKAAALVAQVRLGFAVGLATMISYALRTQDDEAEEAYERLTKRSREDNFQLITDEYDTDMDGNKVRRFLQIPKRGAMKIVANTIEAFMDFSRQNDPEGFQTMIGRILEEVIPLDIKGDTMEEKLMGAMSSVNPAIRVPVEHATGMSFYARRPTVARSMQGAAKGEQYNERTNENVKMLAGIFGESPLKMRQAMESLTGGLSRTLLPDKESGLNLDSPVSVPLVKQLYAPTYREPEDKEYMRELKMEAATESVRRVREANAYMRSVEGVTIPEAYQKAVAAYGRTQPELLARIRELLLQKRAGATREDLQIASLPNRQRAQIVMKRLDAMPQVDRLEAAKVLYRKRVITDATLYEMRKMGFSTN